MHDVVGDAAVIAVLVDEALPAAVDEDTLHLGAGRIPGDRRKALAHVHHGAADARPEEDPGAIIHRSQRELRAQQERGVLPDHLAIQDEAAGAQHYRAPRARKAVLAIDAHYQDRKST